MAVEDINEPVEVFAAFHRNTRGATVVRPLIINWRQRRYQATKAGMRWPTTKGQRMLHRFTLMVDGTLFELEFDAEALTWQLLRTSDGNPT